MSSKPRQQHTAESKVQAGELLATGLPPDLAGTLRSRHHLRPRLSPQNYARAPQLPENRRLGARRPHGHRARHRCPEASPRNSQHRPIPDLPQRRGLPIRPAAHRQLLSQAGMGQNMSARANPITTFELNPSWPSEKRNALRRQLHQRLRRPHRDLLRHRGLL